MSNSFYSIYIFFNVSVLSFILFLSLKYLKKYLSKNNGAFYNDIVKFKNVYIIDENSDVNTMKDFEDKFIIQASKYNGAGFDCEWAPSETISLIQIAFPDGSCFLLRLLKEKSHIPNEFINWMKDSSKLKFGIGVLDDSKKLETQWNIILRGCVDLRHLAVRVRPNGLDHMGLKSFARNWLCVNYSYDSEENKLLSVQCSNWSQDALTAKQIEYASLDALVGSLCPIEFLCRKLNLSPNKALEKLNTIRNYCQGCIDLRFKSKNKSEHNKSTSKKNYKSYSSTKSYASSCPVYDNTILLTPDGEMLSRLSRKKAEWYVKRNLGVQVSDNPLVVKLLFEPSGRSSGQNDYYIQEKENMCVVCGFKEGCVRKNIIPIEYRRHYPVSHKSHKSHDVLPLCVGCHQMSNRIDDSKKKELAEQYSAPLGSRDSVLNKIDSNRSRVKNAAKALLYQNKIPLDRIKELQSILAEFYELNTSSENMTIDKDILLKAASLEISTCDGQYVAHGLKVVQTLTTPVDLVNFEVMWRQHFIKEMQPKYLPIGWSTHHRVDRYSVMNME